MSKITLNNVSSFQNDSSAVATITANNAAITTAFDNTLSRDGTSPNQMSASIDMNSNRILNPGLLDMVGNYVTGLPAATNPTDAVRYQDLLKAGPGGGNVLGPATNANSTIPVWNGVNTKTLKDSGIPSSALTTNLLVLNNTWTGTNTFNPVSGDAITINPLAASSNKGINISQTGPTSGTVAGSVTNASLGNPALAYNQIFINGESASITGASDPKFTYGFNVAMLTGGANSTGGKIAANVILYKSSAANPATVRDHIALNVQNLADFGDGGTGTGLATSKGSCFGMGLGANLRSGATNIFEVSGVEVDVGISTGASAYRRMGITFVGTGNLQAAGQDAAIEISSAGKEWHNGIFFSKAHGGGPVDATGTLIGTDGQIVNAAHGVDFSAYTFSSDAFKSPGFSVDGSGNIVGNKFNKVTITTPLTGSTLTIDDGQTLRSANTLTFASTINSATLTFQGSDTYVGRATIDTLTNKTFDTAGTGNVFRINGTAISAVTGTGNAVLATSPSITTPTIATPTITAGTHTGITNFALRDTSAAFDVTIAATSTSAALTLGRTLTLDMGNVAHTVKFGTTANTITFPNTASDTVGMLAVSNTWSGNNTFSSGAITITGNATPQFLFVPTSGNTRNAQFYQQGDVWNVGASGVGAMFAVSILNGSFGISAGVGVGGGVTQTTNKSTGVTLNKASGAITMNSAALAASTSVGFTLTNNVISASDVVVVNIQSGATADSYHVQVDAVAAGSCRISVRNTSAGSLSEALVLNFIVIKGSNS